VRLETLGFTEVYDYVAGRQDWAAAGLPTEGTEAAKPRAGSIARRDVVTCRPDEALGDVRTRVEKSGINAAVVTDDDGVVLGLLREAQLEAADGTRIDAVMRPGPSTFRPNVPAAEMVWYMTEHDLVNAPITSSDGRLIGLLLRDDAIAAAS
jgi:Mg/Co/Ni transporter MgtE